MLKSMLTQLLPQLIHSLLQHVNPKSHLRLHCFVLTSKVWKVMFPIYQMNILNIVLLCNNCHHNIILGFLDHTMPLWTGPLIH